jgi:hypothetical protein
MDRRLAAIQHHACWIRIWIFWDWSSSLCTITFYIQWDTSIYSLHIHLFSFLFPFLSSLDWLDSLMWFFFLLHMECHSRAWGPGLSTFFCTTHLLSNKGVLSNGRGWQCWLEGVLWCCWHKMCKSWSVYDILVTTFPIGDLLNDERRLGWGDSS